MRSSRCPSARVRRSGAKTENVEKRDNFNQVSSLSDHKPVTSRLTNGRHLPGEDRHGMNGAISPGTTNANSLDSPASPDRNSPRHRLNGTILSGTHSPMYSLSNGLTNGHRPHHETNGHAKVGRSTPSSSPENSSDNNYEKDFLR